MGLSVKLRGNYNKWHYGKKKKEKNFKVKSTLSLHTSLSFHVSYVSEYICKS